MPVKINFNQSGAGVSFSPGVGVPTMMWPLKQPKWHKNLKITHIYTMNCHY